MRIANLGKRIAVLFQALVLMFGLGGATISAVALSAGPAYAADATGTCTGNPNTDGLAGGAKCSQGNSQTTNLFGTGGVFTVAANTLIFVVGAVSVIYLIIGGLRYVVSNGDAKNVTAAKETILYAIVGVVVAVISYALVAFVVNALSTAS